MMARVRTIKEITIKERASIMMDRLKRPDIDNKEFAQEHNIDVRALWIIEKKVNFDQEKAVGAVLANIIEKDNSLIELSTDIKNKWAEWLAVKKRIENKDIETLDRVENTAMKRVLLIKASQEAEEGDKPLDIQITL